MQGMKVDDRWNEEKWKNWWPRVKLSSLLLVLVTKEYARMFATDGLPHYHFDLSYFCPNRRSKASSSWSDLCHCWDRLALRCESFNCEGPCLRPGPSYIHQGIEMFDWHKETGRCDKTNVFSCGPQNPKSSGYDTFSSVSSTISGWYWGSWNCQEGYRAWLITKETLSVWAKM